MTPEPPPKLATAPYNASQDDFYKFANAGDDVSFTEPSLSQRPTETASEAPLALTDNEDTDNINYGQKLAYNGYRTGARVFFGISVVSALLILTLQGYIYAVINIHKHQLGNGAKYQEISIYLALFIFAAVFQVVITVIGLVSRNLLLLFVLCFFYASMLIYSGIQYHEVKDFVQIVLIGHWKTATNACTIATICVIAATLVSQLALLVGYLQKYVGWFKFKNIGGDLRIKRYYNIFQIHRSLLIFAFFFFLGFTIQFLIIMIDNKRSTEFILTVCVIPLTIIVLFASDLAIAKEWLIMGIGCVLVYLGGVAYVLFKMIRLFTKYTSAYHISLRPGDYFPGRSSLITFGVITLIFLGGIVITEIVLMANFQKGLKPIVGHPKYFKRAQAQPEPKEEEEWSIS